MRSIATALESYFIDEDSYPGGMALERFVPGGGVELAAIERASGEAKPTPAGRFFVPLALTTPVAYVNEIYGDPFGNHPIAYAAVGEHWMLVSPGPDRVFQIDPETDFDPEAKDPTAGLVPYTYDPTNGITSGGDIWRVKQ